MKALWWHYSAGYITKEDLDATLRSHQAAIDATKSEQREEADALLLGIKIFNAVDILRSRAANMRCYSVIRIREVMNVFPYNL